jgi:hypothetical protein
MPIFKYYFLVKYYLFFSSILKLKQACKTNPHGINYFTAGRILTLRILIPIDVSTVPTKLLNFGLLWKFTHFIMHSLQWNKNYICVYSTPEFAQIQTKTHVLQEEGGAWINCDNKYAKMLIDEVEA